LWKNKTTALINIVGLSTGLTCCLLMVLYLQHEISYDKFQEKGDRVVRVIMEYGFNDGPPTKGNFTSTKVFPAFKRNFPEVEDGVRMTLATRLVKYREHLFNEKKFMYADSTFFNVFPSFKLKIGQAGEVLKDPNRVVLTESAARKYFGNISDAVGKTLEISSRQDPFLVTGVVEDCPSNSQIKFDFLASFSSLGETQEETYWNANFTTYLLLKDQPSIASLQAKIKPFMKKEMANVAGAYVNFELEPYTKIHLYSPYDGFEPNSNIMYIYIIGAIALLILVIACFTYINLSTARSLERAKEVGIRKVAGAFRSQVFWQFIGESSLLTFVSLLLSTVLAALLLPAFNQLSERNLQITGLWSPLVIGTALFFVLSISLLAGSYPALILSKFQPVKVLKGAFKNTGSGNIVRKSLIVFQFTISVFLIIATFVIQQQLRFIQNKKLGYNRDHVLIMSIDQKIIDKIELVKTEFKRNPNVLVVSKAYNTPVNIVGGYSMQRLDWPEDRVMSVKANPIDEDYLAVNNIKIIAGTNINRQDVLDASHQKFDDNYYHYIINEAAARALGWTPEEAVGKKLSLNRPGEIKAVIQNFHFASLHTPIEPLVLFPGGWGNTLMVKTTGQNLAGTIQFLETKWKEFAPHRPFEYRFMEEDFQKLYDTERRTGKVFTIFAGIAILLACLGLFGLSVYATQQRIKEIGIRKVLGASVSSITVLLSSKFIVLVLVAFVIASPIAWFVMNKWLQDFSYRIELSWWMFLMAALAVMLITFITVCFQSVKAAVMNPVKSLRTE
jgi:putative ABC transport system permease protein